MSRPLVLERKDQANETPVIAGLVALTPAIDEDYWAYRVRLTDEQAVIGFPKFYTIGIGFAVEEDWNTNLPYTVEADRIFEHIRHNKGDDSIADQDVLDAIRMIQDAVVADGGPR